MISQLLTVKQMAESCPAYSEAALRALIFSADEYGLEDVFIRVGRKVLVNAPLFAERISKGITRKPKGQSSKRSNGDGTASA